MSMGTLLLFVFSGLIAAAGSCLTGACCATAVVASAAAKKVKKKRRIWRLPLRFSLPGGDRPGSD